MGCAKGRKGEDGMDGWHWMPGEGDTGGLYATALPITEVCVRVCSLVSQSLPPFPLLFPQASPPPHLLRLGCPAK